MKHLHYVRSMLHCLGENAAFTEIFMKRNLSEHPVNFLTMFCIKIVERTCTI
jgi:hypothetical protein